MGRRMKILLLATMVLLALGNLIGCGKRPEEIQNQFTELIAAKAEPESMAETAELLDKYLGRMDKKSASEMLVLYEDFVLQYINTDSDQPLMQSLSTFYKDGQIQESLIKKDETMQGYYNLLANAYIRVVKRGDKICLQLDYQRLYDQFKKSISPSLADLYQLRATIAAKPATENAVIQIPYKELLDRALSVEGLIDRYRGDPLIEEDVKWLYTNYLNLIILGSTNSPCFDYQTGEFSQEVKDQYNQFIAEHPDTVIAWALREYEKYLKSIDYKINYKDKDMSKAHFENCGRIISEAEKRVFQ